MEFDKKFIALTSTQKRKALQSYHKTLKDLPAETFHFSGRGIYPGNEGYMLQVFPNEMDEVIRTGKAFYVENISTKEYIPQVLTGYPFRQLFKFVGSATDDYKLIEQGNRQYYVLSLIKHFEPVIDNNPELFDDVEEKSIDVEPYIDPTETAQVKPIKTKRGPYKKKTKIEEVKVEETKTVVVEETKHAEANEPQDILDSVKFTQLSIRDAAAILWRKPISNKQVINTFIRTNNE